MVWCYCYKICETCLVLSFVIMGNLYGPEPQLEEGNFGVWLYYILTGAGANLVSWLILPRNAVSVGASGAVFGLFAISVPVKLSFDKRKILELLILGQFVIERVMEAAQASTSFGSMLYRMLITLLIFLVLLLVQLWFIFSVEFPLNQERLNHFGGSKRNKKSRLLFTLEAAEPVECPNSA